MCRAHATVRGVLGELMAGSADGGRMVIVDMEAGLEHLSRATARHVDVLVTVVEPYFRAMEAAKRIVELARELEIGRIEVAANKVRGDDDLEILRQFAAANELELDVVVPFDDAFIEAERAGTPPLDHAPDAPGVRAIAGWSRRFSGE